MLTLLFLFSFVGDGGGVLSLFFNMHVLRRRFSRSILVPCMPQVVHLERSVCQRVDPILDLCPGLFQALAVCLSPLRLPHQTLQTGRHKHSHLFFHSPGDEKSMLRVQANSQLVDGAFSLQMHLYGAFPLGACGERGGDRKRESTERREIEKREVSGVSSSFCKDTSSIGFKPHPYDLI